MSIKDNSDNEILRPDPHLADDVKLYPSGAFGVQAAVAIKGGNPVCWNCFDVIGGNFTDLVMGQTVVRFCTRKACHKKAAQRNSAREQELWEKANRS